MPLHTHITTHKNEKTAYTLSVDKGVLTMGVTYGVYTSTEVSKLLQNEVDRRQHINPEQNTDLTVPKLMTACILTIINNDQLTEVIL